MARSSFGPRRGQRADVKREKVEDVIARARQAQAEREKSYREQSLKIHPWVCARCGREFNHRNVHELTVHHKDGNHDNNPPDGSNWENLCIYCHENEHRRHLDYLESKGIQVGDEKVSDLTHKPFASLKGLIDKKP
ncbi:MAG: YajD family HNH nuclease [Deltaproteobacteria bacterium]|nr:YajD family HNH nuclease [Deltaproteobacteria bacterium]OQX62246.1 MAG: HNH endonuclease [Desulfococcus sp. 4484_242]